jgi:hypothetical protein
MKCLGSDHSLSFRQSRIFCRQNCRMALGRDRTHNQQARAILCRNEIKSTMPAGISQERIVFAFQTNLQAAVTV